jgi:hypothetical protein
MGDRARGGGLDLQQERPRRLRMRLRTAGTRREHLDHEGPGTRQVVAVEHAAQTGLGHLLGRRGSHPQRRPQVPGAGQQGDGHRTGSGRRRGVGLIPEVPARGEDAEGRSDGSCVRNQEPGGWPHHGHQWSVRHVQLRRDQARVRSRRRLLAAQAIDQHDDERQERDSGRHVGIAPPDAPEACGVVLRQRFARARRAVNRQRHGHPAIGGQQARRLAQGQGGAAIARSRLRLPLRFPLRLPLRLRLPPLGNRSRRHLRGQAGAPA